MPGCVQTVWVGEPGVVQAQLGRARVHLSDERRHRAAYVLGERICCVVGRGHERQFEELPHGERLACAQAKRVVHVRGGFRDRHFVVEVRSVEHHERDHDLGDARHRPAGRGPPSPQRASVSAFEQPCCRVDVGRADAARSGEPRATPPIWSVESRAAIAGWGASSIALAVASRTAARSIAAATSSPIAGGPWTRVTSAAAFGWRALTLCMVPSVIWSQVGSSVPHTAPGLPECARDYVGAVPVAR